MAEGRGKAGRGGKGGGGRGREQGRREGEGRPRDALTPLAENDDDGRFLI